MRSLHKLTTVLLSAVFLFGCLDKGNKVTTSEPKKDDVVVVQPKDTTVSIVAPESQEISEQTEWSVRADISAVNEDNAPVSAAVSWEITDAPEGFEMALTGGNLVDGTSIIEFDTPDVDEDTTVTLRVTAETAQTDTQNSNSMTSDITLNILANGEVVVSGAVVDDPIPFAIVTVKVGEQTYEVQADANGNYTLEVEFADPTVVVEVTAVGAPGSGFEAVEFKSYLGSGETLIEEAGADGELTPDENIGINVSNVTTAVYVLVQDIIEEQNTEDSTEAVILDQQELDELVEQVDSEEVIEVAAVIQLVVDYGASLPEGTETVLDLAETLVDDEEATEDFIEESVEQIVEENNDIESLSLDDLIEDIVSDANLVPSAEEEQFLGSFYVANGVTSVSSQFTQDDLLFGKIALNADNSGTVENFLTAGDRTLTWEVSGTKMVATFDAQVLLDNEHYGLTDNYRILLDGFTINELDDNGENRSWLVRLAGQLTNIDDNTSSDFDTGSLAVVATPEANLVAYSEAELLNNSAYLSVIDNASSSSDNEEALLNASSVAVNFSEDNVASFENGAGATVSATWEVTTEGILLLEIEAMGSAPAQSLSYARIRPVTDSIANYLAVSVETSEVEYAFSDISYVEPQTPSLTDFELLSTFKVIGADDTFTFLSDGTGFFYNPSDAMPFEHFSYTQVGNDVELEVPVNGSRACLVTSQTCTTGETLDIAFDHFETGRLTLHLESQITGDALEEVTAIANEIRDQVLSAEEIPGNINLYLAEDQSIHSLFLESDGTGRINAGSTDGQCSDISWLVSETGRLQVTIDGSTTQYSLLAGDLQQGLIWSESVGGSADSQLFETTAQINECAEADEVFITLTEADVKETGYELINNDDGEVTVLRLAADNTGYVVSGADYFNESLSDTISEYLDLATWSVVEGRLIVAEDGQGGDFTQLPNQLTLLSGQLSDGLVLVRQDQDADGEYETVLSLTIKSLRGCEIDTDGDGMSNCFDMDDDNDGTEDSSDAFPRDDSETLDTDKDGIGNNTDTDDDGDGVLDVDDADPLDPEVGASQTFTSAMVLNKQFVEFGGIREGFLPNRAPVLSFVTSDANHYSADNGGIILTNTFDWDITDDKLTLDNGSINQVVFNYYPFDLTSYGFEQKVSDDLNAAYESGLMSENYVEIQYGVIERSFTLVQANEDSLDVVSQSTTQYAIASVHAAEIVGSVNSTFVQDPTEVTLVDSGAAINVADSVADLAGEWALPIEYQLDADTPWFSNGYNFLIELMDIDDSGEALGSVSGQSWTASIDGNKFILSSGSTDYIYSVLMQNGDLHLAMVEKQVSGVTESFYAGQVVKVNSVASSFIDDIESEFPEVVLAHINSAYEQYWTDDTLDLDMVWGYRFGANGQLDRGVSGITVESDWQGFGIDYFYLGNTDWTWGTSGNQVTHNWVINSGTTDEYARNRFWDVIGVTDSGYTLVFERSRGTRDFNFDGEISAEEQDAWLILPRINVLQKESLADWETAWSNTQQLGLLSTADFDNDGMADNVDADDDNDGYSDAEEIMLGSDPMDPDSNGTDTDGDGTIDALDNDDDNDGVLDEDDVAPLNPDVGQAMTLTEDTLADGYIVIGESALSIPSFNFTNSGDYLSFDKTNNTYEFSSFYEYDTGSYSIANNSMEVDGDGDSEFYYEYLWDLVELGLISQEKADAYYSQFGTDTVFIEESNANSTLYLIAQSATEDTFWISDQRQYSLVEDADNEFFFGSTTPVVYSEEEGQTMTFTRYDSLTQQAATTAMFDGTTWALPAHVNPENGDNFYAFNSELVTFSGNTFTTEIFDLSGTWSIVDDALELTYSTGESVTLRLFGEEEGMTVVHAMGHGTAQYDDGTTSAVTYSRYQVAGELDGTSDFDGFTNNFVMNSFTLLAPDAYDDAGELVAENMWILHFADDNVLSRFSGGFDLVNPQDTWDWQLESGRMVTRQTYDRMNFGFGDCTRGTADCVDYRTRYWQPIMRTGDRLYLLEWSNRNTTVWENVYDETADMPFIHPRIVFYEVTDVSHLDADADGISDSFDIDIDGDGVENDYDLFPLDPAESADFDGDGIGDNADLDDDNDGVNDDEDIAPNDPELGAKVTITDTTLADKYITINPGRLTDPNFNLRFVNGEVYEFSATELEQTGRNGQALRDVEIINGNLVLTGFDNLAFEYLTVWDMESRGLITADDRDEFLNIYGDFQIELETSTVSQTWSLIEQESDSDKFYIQEVKSYQVVDLDYRTQLFGASDAAPLEIDSGNWTSTLTHYSSVAFVDFVASDLDGIIALPGLPLDANNDGALDYVVSDVLEFGQTSGMSVTGLTNVFDWEIQNGELHLDFGDQVTAVIRKHETYRLSESYLATLTTPENEYSLYSLGMSQNDSRGFDNLKNKFVITGLTLTDPNSFDGNELLEEEIWGFRVEDGGLVRNIYSSAPNLSYQDGTWHPEHWDYEGDNLVIKRDYNEYWEFSDCRTEEMRCNNIFTRQWYPLAQDGDRVYVLEWREINTNYADFDSTEQNYEMNIPPRVNIYTVYDLMLDTDSDGVIDSEDTDIDGDGFLNEDDDLPLNADENVDTDGDGFGDNSDVFPNDSTEWADFDMDGIGNNEDTDDDNDGILDVDDPNPYADSRTLSMLTFADTQFSQCLLDKNGDIAFQDVYTVDCYDYGITSIEGIEQLYNLENVYLNNEPVADFSPIQSLANLYNFSSTKSGFSDADLAAVVANDNLRHVWLEIPNVTTIEPIRNHPNLNDLHLWGSAPDLEMDVLLSLNAIETLAISTVSVDSIDLLGQMTSLTRLWLHGDLSAGEATALAPLTNLYHLSIGWGSPFEQGVYDNWVSQLPNLQSLEISNQIVPDMSFLLNLADFNSLYLHEGQFQILSQQQTFLDSGIDVSQYLSFANMSAGDIIGQHILHDIDIDTDPVVVQDVPVVFNSDFSGTIDWGFGDETFSWSLDDQGRVLVLYDNTNENDRWSWVNPYFDGEGYQNGQIAIEIDLNGDGVYDEHDYKLRDSSKGDSFVVSKTDVVGYHKFTDPSDATEYEIFFADDFTGSATWDDTIGLETFTWSFDTQGAVIVDYDDPETIEVDRWTWSVAYRGQNGVYLSGVFQLEIANNGDGVYDEFVFDNVDTYKQYYDRQLMGAWYLGSETDDSDYNVLVFVDEYRYYVGHTKNMENSNLVSGEFGTYTWDHETGAFQATIVGESDGQGGLGEGAKTITIDGSSLTIAESGESDVVASKVEDVDLQGAWLVESSSDDYSIFVVLDSTRYFVMHTSNSENDNAIAGEYGTYVYDTSTGFFDNTILDESDGEGGVGTSGINIEELGSQINIYDADTGVFDTTANRIKPSFF